MILPAISLKPTEYRSRHSISFLLVVILLHGLAIARPVLAENASMPNDQSTPAANYLSEIAKNGILRWPPGLCL